MFTGLFVFKQKTAYEMRMSDWSSDVCSSDLTSSKIVLETTSDARVKSFATMMIGDHGKSTAMLKSAAAASDVKAPPPGLTPDQQATVAALQQARGVDRTSVVSGKSVSGRVALGGRRIIKKKTIHKQRN